MTLMFRPNRKFKRDYDRIFRKDQAAANVFLLLAELADERGVVKLGVSPGVELQKLMATRFKYPHAYQLPGGPKR